MDWKRKLTSRKFWISVAAMLGSIATSIAGLAISNGTVTAIGMVCGVVSAAIYAAAEAYVDGKSVGAAGTEAEIVAETAEKKETTEKAVDSQ